MTCGYRQIPEVDYSDSFSPVVHDIIFRAFLLAMMVEDLPGKIADVETVFFPRGFRGRDFHGVSQGYGH